MADKHIDAALTVGAVGIAGVVEMSTLGIVDFVDIPADLIKKVGVELPYTYLAEGNATKILYAFDRHWLTDNLRSLWAAVPLSRPLDGTRT